MATWIISAGAEGRDYTEYFLDYGLAFVGGDSQRAAMKQIALGDVILLKRGLSEFVAAGIVVERGGVHSGDGDKPWLRDFDGWELPAYCHVEWHVSPKPEPATGLRMGTIYQTSQPPHIEAAQRLLSLPARGRRPEPAPTNAVTDEAILSFLIGQGLRVHAADDLTDALRRIRLLAEYYYKNWRWRDIREHETRTFLVVPLLLALGWAEQQLKIELPAPNGRVDIACFPGSYKGEPSDAIVLIETKGFASGLDYAPEQARSYAQHFKQCQVVLVTNGYCYKTYLRESSGNFSTKPSAYLNIRDPRDHYPIDPECAAGALEVLRWLMPTTLSREQVATPKA